MIDSDHEGKHIKNETQFSPTQSKLFLVKAWNMRHAIWSKSNQLKFSLEMKLSHPSGLQHTYPQKLAPLNPKAEICRSIFTCLKTKSLKEASYFIRQIIIAFKIDSRLIKFNKTHYF